ncbi:MAG: 3-isopropylmalate dehydratase small subunit [Bacillota bacterium]
MDQQLQGKAYTFGLNIDTDQIYPGRYLDLYKAEDLAKHAMEGADPTFVQRFSAGGIIVADRNFGCGSSREHAAITLKTVGVAAVIAESFARIFFRNAINLGLPALECKGISKMVKEGDELSVNLATGEISNLTTGRSAKAEGLNDYVLNILNSGGIKPLFKKKYGIQE